MKRTIILFYISLLIAMYCSSQTTYPHILNDSLVIITAEQLKQTNLIFLEHDKLTKENAQLLNKINQQNQMINNYIKIDSLNIKKQAELNNTIDNLKSDIKKKSKTSVKKGILFGSGLGIAVTSLVFLLVK